MPNMFCINTIYLNKSQYNYFFFSLLIFEKYINKKNKYIKMNKL